MDGRRRMHAAPSMTWTTVASATTLRARASSHWKTYLGSSLFVHVGAAKSLATSKKSSASV